MRKGHFIGGETQLPPNAAFLEVKAPVDGRVIGEVARGTAEDVDRAVHAARAAQPAWWGMAPAQRERTLLRVADEIERRKPELLDMVMDESGSTITKAHYEVDYSASLFRVAAGEARRLYGETMPHDNPARMSMVFREPLGVVGVISPFNAPLVLLTKMLAFPIAVGNAAVVKPSEETPLIALMLAEICAAAGVPAGVVNVVNGLGHEAGAALSAHPGVDGIAFTGSTRAGRMVAAEAAKRSCRVQLELGGKSALVVLDDVDVKKAAALTVQGAFTHGGQICMANSRVVVTRGVAEAYIEALVHEAQALKLGDLRDEATAYGALIHEGAAAKVQDHVEGALAAGGVLLTGGEPLGRTNYQPTVVRTSNFDCALWRDETFGPTIALAVADDVAHAVSLANDSEYALSAGILTRDLEVAFGVARQLRSGSVHIGFHAFQSNALSPIGGPGASGIGRSGGKYSTEEFTELKWITVSAGGVQL